MISFAVDPLTLLARAILALGAGLIVPLGLSASAPASDQPVHAFHTFARKVVPICAVGLLSSLVVTSGGLAHALVLPWVAASALVALVGFRRLLARLSTPARFDLGELAIDAGYMYLPVGAAWAWVYRADIDVLGFAGLQALLTANHFHFAGFGACVLIGLLGRKLGSGPRDLRGPTYRAAALLAIAAVALVAAGITVSHSLEVVAAWALVLGVLLAAWNLVRLARVSDGPSRVLLFTSAASSVVAAGFAAHFATGGFARLDSGALQRMLFFHALVNAFGFVGAGLLGMKLRRAG